MANKHARQVLEPLIHDFLQVFNSGDFDRMADLYHTNAVMVEKDKSVLWGKKGLGRNIADHITPDISASLLEMATELGKTTMEISNTKYDGDGEFPRVYTDFAFHTEKGGTLNGSFLQIWRRDGDTYTIYHDEYEMH